MYAKREKHDFSVMSGGTVQADFLESEFYIYPYVSNRGIRGDRAFLLEDFDPSCTPRS